MRRYWWVLAFVLVWIAVAATDARTVLPQETPTPDITTCEAQLWLCWAALDSMRDKVDAWCATATAEHDAARRLVAEARATARTAEQDAHDLAHEIARCGRVVRWAGALPEVRR